MLKLNSKRLFAIFILIPLLLSCRISSNKDLVNYFTNEVEVFSQEYDSIVSAIDQIKTKNVRYMIHRFPNSEKHLQVMEYFAQDSSFVEDFEFPERFHQFFLARKITGLLVEVKKEVQFSYLHKRNKGFGGVFLIYFYDGFNENKHDYKKKGFAIFESDEKIPKKQYNWLYKINQNWAILSKERSPLWFDKL